MSEAEEIAKAIQESAKLGAEGVDVAKRAGGFFARVFKEPAEEVSGMITDKLRFIRWKRLVKMGDNVNAILASKGVRETRAVPPKIALPIMEEATLEDDPDLQNLWERLLANAMNPSFNDEIRYGFIDMIKNITGIEAVFIKMFYGALQKEERLKPIAEVHNHILSKEQMMELLKINEDQYAVAANNLMRMQLIAPAVLKVSSIRVGNEPTTIFKGIDAITLTPLGVKFVEACIK